MDTSLTGWLGKAARRPSSASCRSKKAAKFSSAFEHWGFWAVAVPALLPPPFPIVPFLLAAGAMQYSRQKFVSALALGRGVRFMVVAGLGAIYGRHIIRFFSRYYKPALFTLIGLGGDCRDFFPVSVLPLQEPDSDGLDNYDHTRSVASLCGATNTLFDLSSL